MYLHLRDASVPFSAAGTLCLPHHYIVLGQKDRQIKITQALDPRCYKFFCKSWRLPKCRRAFLLFFPVRKPSRDSIKCIYCYMYICKEIENFKNKLSKNPKIMLLTLDKWGFSQQKDELFEDLTIKGRHCYYFFLFGNHLETQ